MNRSAFIPFTIALLTFGYGFADFFSFTDNLWNRTEVMNSWYRLSTVESGDSVIMFDDELGFQETVEFLVARTKNIGIKETIKFGKKPTALMRLGGVERPDIGPVTNFNGLAKYYALPSSPIFIGFNYKRDYREKGYGDFLCTLGDISGWVDNHRNTERFIVYGVLIASLSLVIAFIELSKKKIMRETSNVGHEYAEDHEQNEGRS